MSFPLTSFTLTNLIIKLAGKSTFVSIHVLRGALKIFLRIKLFIIKINNMKNKLIRQLFIKRCFSTSTSNKGNYCMDIYRYNF
jgi:hypothetical protein